jgi:hypothetical protein
VIGDSEPGLAALETIESGKAPAQDGPEARTIQRIVVRKALGDEKVKDDLVAVYRFIGGEEDDLSMPIEVKSHAETPGDLADIGLFDKEQITALHQLGITSVADLVGAIQASKAALARMLQVDEPELDRILREARDQLSDELFWALEEAVPKHGYGLAIGEG